MMYYHNYLKSSDYLDNKPYSIGANPYDADITYNRLINLFPFDPTEPIEKNIVQMWKTKITDPSFPYNEFFNQWTNLNPDYNHVIITNDELSGLVNEYFNEKMPEIIQAFELLPKPVLKSDFMRYIWIYINGGFYCDMDVSARAPINQWVDLRDDSIKGLVSLEGDFNTPDWEKWLPRRIQFIQWALKFKKHHHALARVIANIVKVTFEARASEKLVPYYKDFQDVDRCKSIDIMDWTGPGIFTDSIFEFLNDGDLNIIDYDSHRTNLNNELFGPESGSSQSLNNRVNWKTFTGIDSPVVVNGLGILPSSGFRCESEDVGKYCYARHWFSGGWKQG
ncbi:glycosyltransferase family 32 protein [[Candida] arabinofermentans NRRL YB-2248]|uniref:Glycosyltransferase family 32 protein n=1 Tax=[Candida] arabinofermentans NRRL YB-2248 TaxID=983967 RepID=A0A1E4SY22_9ASCO|nr:glycosyltransferase family 32 protein [[Candida] arabinofermentans NRRL YB-2248]